MLPLRRDLEEVTPYASPQLPARLRLNTNESPYAPPARVAEALRSEIEAMSLNRYPDRDAHALVDGLSSKWEWPREGIWVANGSNEVFMHLFLAFGGPGRKALTFEPTYALHSLVPRVALTEVDHLPRGESFEIDADAATRYLEAEGIDVVIVCSPNNPTGGCVDLRALERLLEAAPGLVVVDEAYGEFADPGTSAIPLLGRYENLVVVRTFSKAWSLAGVRIGYMLAASALVETMAVVRLPYHLSSLAQSVAVAALGAESETMEAVAAITSERDRVTAALGALDLRAIPSQANFVLFEVADAAATWKSLYERGVLVRSYERSPLLARYLRVTIGLPDENDAFLDALEEVLS